MFNKETGKRVLLSESEDPWYIRYSKSDKDINTDSDANSDSNSNHKYFYTKMFIRMFIIFIFVWLIWYCTF